MDEQNWTFWLNMTNLALGVVTFLPLLMVFGAVVWELIDRRVRRAHATRSVASIH
jgi:hypothetical protein